MGAAGRSILVKGLTVLVATAIGLGIAEVGIRALRLGPDIARSADPDR